MVEARDSVSDAVEDGAGEVSRDEDMAEAPVQSRFGPDELSALPARKKLSEERAGRWPNTIQVINYVKPYLP